MTTVTWVQDGSGNYEVSSAEHLKQLMHKGTLYTDAGSFPVNYWGSGASYIQTSNIDLLNDPTDIVVIGFSADRFYGIYDGGNFSISNWSYLDPFYATTDRCELSVGIFGHCQTATLQNMKISGITSIRGYHSNCGVLVGNVYNVDVSNIVLDFATGSNVKRGVTTTDSTYASFGCCFGRMSGTSTVRNIVTGLEIKGSIDALIDGVQEFSTIGGVTGWSRYATYTLINLNANITNFTGTYVGGMTGRTEFTIFDKVINSMSGNITAEINAGGICSYFGTATNSITNTVNAMTGNIVVTGTSAEAAAGGICGSIVNGTVFEGIFNYMNGDITGIVTGGIIGTLGGDSITNSIIAMNGNVENAVIGIGPGTLSGDIEINTDFGLTYTSIGTFTSTPATGFLTLSGFPLPYFEISGTDTIGNTYDYDFVFANIGGNSNYTTSHLIISGGVGTFQDGVIPPLFSTIPRVSSVTIGILPVVGAVAYRLTSQITGSSEMLINSGFTDLVQIVLNLNPETEYTFRLYSTTDGSVYTLVESSVKTTLPNLPTNYDKNDYLSGGTFDLRSLDQSSFGLISDIMNDIFTTGDIMKVNVTRNPDVSKFVNRGDTLDITGADAVVAPFSTTGGTGQNFSLTLSDTSTVNVTYDDTTEEVTVDSTPYNTGDSFILDGKKVTIVDI